MTAPLGYNPALDELVVGGTLAPARQASMVREDAGWQAAPEPVVLPYGSRGWGAASVWVAEFVL